MKRFFRYLLNHRTITNTVIILMLSTLVLISATNLKTVETKADSRVVYNGNTESNNICFMINVYENSEYVENILDVLDVYSVKTTFFIGGCWAVNNMSLVKEIYKIQFSFVNELGVMIIDETLPIFSKEQVENLETRGMFNVYIVGEKKAVLLYDKI